MTSTDVRAQQDLTAGDRKEVIPIPPTSRFDRRMKEAFMAAAENKDHKPGRGRVYNSITETIGDTPLVRMARMPQAAGVKADLLFKLEFFNPIASVKERIGVSMI